MTVLLFWSYSLQRETTSKSLRDLERVYCFHVVEVVLGNDIFGALQTSPPVIGPCVQVRELRNMHKAARVINFSSCSSEVDIYDLN